MNINIKSEFYSLAGTFMNSTFYSIADTNINVHSQPYSLADTNMNSQTYCLTNISFIYMSTCKEN